MRRFPRPTSQTRPIAPWSPEPRALDNVLPAPHNLDTESSLAKTRPIAVVR